MGCTSSRSNSLPWALDMSKVMNTWISVYLAGSSTPSESDRASSTSRGSKSRTGVGRSSLTKSGSQLQQQQQRSKGTDKIEKGEMVQSFVSITDISEDESDEVNQTRNMYSISSDFLILFNPCAAGGWFGHYKMMQKTLLKPWQLVLIWEYSVRAIQWIPTWHGLICFQTALNPCGFDESSLSIERVKTSTSFKLGRYMYP